MKSEWRGRLNHWLRTLKEDFYTPLGEISWTAHKTMDHISPEEAEKLAVNPVAPGFTWGDTWEYCWFRGTVTLPKEAKGERIVMNLNPGGESTIFVNGKAFGTYRADWVREPHHFMVDNALTRCAQGDEEFDILMETYAGHYYAESPTGGCATGPVLPGYYKDSLEEGKRRVLGECTYGIWNETAYQLYMDAMTLNRLLEVLDEDSLRAAKVEEALEQFTLAVDFEQDRKQRIESYEKGREVLKPALLAVNGSTMPVFYAVGNAHLDLAWLWPMAETHRKTARTFAAQLRLIEEYPEYKFIQSQPASYEMCRKYYPELFERIVEAAKKGQWIADGAMWVEPDTNMAGGEALVRQLVHGKRYYKDVFGIDSQILWLPDTFGYTAALPQILKECGVKYLVTQKIFWSYNEGEKFPYHYFRWEGMDGSSIVSFLPTNYTYDTQPAEVNNTWNKRTQRRDLEAFLYPYGYGDGGGGPARDYIEYCERQKDLEGGVRVKMAGPMEFFDDMEALGGPKHTYTGELYFSAHRGTFTSQAAIKRNNRKCELALREMEIWGTAAAEEGREYPLSKADGLWKGLLLNQFHDILPGSSIARVYVESEKQVGAVIGEAEKEAKEAISFYRSVKEASGQEGVGVFNSLPFERNALVALPDSFTEGAATKEGESVPVWESEEGKMALVTVPAFGGVSLVPSGTVLKKGGALAAKEEDGYRLENEVLTARIDENGQVVSFVLKESGREFAAGSMNKFLLYKDVPRLFDAWDIDSNYKEQLIEDAVSVESISITKEGGAEAEICVKGTIGNSSFEQKIRLEASSRRLLFETTVDWKELHRLLKTAFPVTVHAEEGINEMQFGYVTRPTRRSRDYDKDRFEVCNHRYSALADGSHGAAILNESKYGISMNENALELSLLRAASCPEMRADNRIHHFTYGFTAWEGCFAGCDVVKQGYELNVPVTVESGCFDAFSLAQTDKDNVILETMKPAEDGSGDIVLRLYESKKAAVSAEIKLNFAGRKAYLCDMLENKKEEIPFENQTLHLDFGAFEIKTVRLVKEGK